MILILDQSVLQGIKTVNLSFGDLTGIVVGQKTRSRDSQKIIPVEGEGSYATLATTRSGGVKIRRVESSNDREVKVLALISSDGPYSKGSAGTVKCSPDCEVIAEGGGVHSPTGSCGTFEVKLAIIPENGIVRVRPTGNYKAEVYFLINRNTFLERITEAQMLQVYENDESLPLPMVEFLKPFMEKLLA